MIALAVALLIQQAAPLTIPPVAQPPAPADVPTSVERLLKHCRVAVEARQRSTALGHRMTTTRMMLNYDRTVDGATTRLWADPSGCEIVSDRWRPEGDRLAETVRANVSNWPHAFSVTAWRDAKDGEPLPTVWTSLEQRDADGRVIAVLEVIEPADGAIGEAKVTYRLVAS